MISNWQHTFRKRMRDFKSQHNHPEDGIPVSIKIRASSGCYHRQHSPIAYAIIDKFLEKVYPQEEFSFEEHENGPEILVIVATTAVIGLATSVINLIVTILKARSESVKKGNYPNAPLELIVRRVYKVNEYREETVLRICHDDIINPKEIEEGLKKSLEVILSPKDKENG
ncbi:hypothetical protein KKB18_11275 [bacterium]|nr:hypothetical protein [bacterium]